jgi:hypothetical protein
MDEGLSLRGSGTALSEECGSSCRVPDAATSVVREGLSSARGAADETGVGVNCRAAFVGGVSGTVEVETWADEVGAAGAELELRLLSASGFFANPLPKGFLFRIDFCVAMRIPWGSIFPACAGLPVVGTTVVDWLGNGFVELELADIFKIRRVVFDNRLDSQ